MLVSPMKGGPCGPAISTSGARVTQPTDTHADGTVPLVDVGDDAKVFRLRDAVKKKFKDSHIAGIAAADLTVFANRTAFDAKQKLPKSSSSVSDFGKDEDNALIVQVPMQRPVVVPTLSQQSFVWKEPKSLVGSTGRHYQAWRDGKTDKRSHPLLVCLDGPGTGKSRLLDEFPNVLQQQVGALGDLVMNELLRNAYTFKVTFENGTTDNEGFEHPREMIGTRMLYQLQDSIPWMTFAGQRTFHLDPEQALTKLSEITKTALCKICVILCVDSLQKLQHEAGSKRSQFYAAFASLCDLVNASKCWVIAMCSATIYQPVDEFLVDSPQWRVKLHTTSLKRPEIDGIDVFGTFNDDNGTLTQFLVDDMGGHGRALEELFNVMEKHEGQGFQFIMMHDVLLAVRHAYPAIIAQMHSMKEALLAVISRRSVDGNSRFGSLTLDQVISCGLIRRNGAHLQCPFVLYMLLETYDFPWNKHATYAPAERYDDLKLWQLWGQFNCKFRALKSQAFAQEKPVLWTDIHYGARFGAGCNRQVIERRLTYALATKLMSIQAKGFKKGKCSCGNDLGKCFMHQSADGSPSGDAFLCLEDATKGFFHDIHQCKWVAEKLPLDVFEQERPKAAGPDDLFIMYCTSEVTADLRTLPNSAFVDATCWESYYGPFAARAFFIKSVPLPCINTSSQAQLEFVEGPSYSARIEKKRPFTSLEDAPMKTKAPAKVLKRLSFNMDPR